MMENKLTVVAEADEFWAKEDSPRPVRKTLDSELSEDDEHSGGGISLQSSSPPATDAYGTYLQPY